MKLRRIPLDTAQLAARSFICGSQKSPADLRRYERIERINADKSSAYIRVLISKNHRSFGEERSHAPYREDSCGN